MPWLLKGWEVLILPQLAYFSLLNSSLNTSEIYFNFAALSHSVRPIGLCCPRHFWAVLPGGAFLFLLPFRWSYLCCSKSDPFPTTTRVMAIHISSFSQFQSRANLRIPPHLPLSSHCLLASLLIDQKPNGDKNLLHLNSWWNQRIGTNL